VLSSEAPFVRRCVAAFIGGGLGGVTWAYLKAFEGVDLVKALGIGACAFFAAELVSSIVRPGWRRGMLGGLTGGFVVGLGGVLLFPIEDAARHIAVTAISIMIGALVASAVHERFARKDCGS
jgi:hypothetical protein